MDQYVNDDEGGPGWFEADASYKGAAYFDKYNGSQKDGFVKGSPDYFDKASFAWQEDKKDPHTSILAQGA